MTRDEPKLPTLRRNFSWTFAGNALYAAAQWGMLTVLAKLGTPQVVGQFALGLAITAPVRNGENGEKDLREYLKLFEGVSSNVRAGEASTFYLYLANTAREIKQIQGDAKIIIILRNPVDWTYSHYCLVERRMRGREVKIRKCSPMLYHT